MEDTMVDTTKRNRELVADPAAQRPRLRKSQVMGVGRNPTADQARELGNHFDMLAIPNPAWRWQCQDALVDYGLSRLVLLRLRTSIARSGASVGIGSAGRRRPGMRSQLKKAMSGMRIRPAQRRIVPNRRGIWARLDRTPFGSGRPYTMSQLSQLLRDELFTPVATSAALFVPPSRSRMMLRSARAWERIAPPPLRALGTVSSP